MESVVTIIPQFSMLSEYNKIDIRNSDHGLNVLQNVFSKNIANCYEGLVLKPTYGLYNSSKWRWIKVKRDYIPGLGDTADFVIIGARHDQQRGRELLVPTKTLTTFTVALQANESDMRSLRKRNKINVRILLILYI